jgi:hypothetical protein
MLKELQQCSVGFLVGDPREALRGFDRIGKVDEITQGGERPEVLELTAAAVPFDEVLKALRPSEVPHFQRHMYVLACLLHFRDCPPGSAQTVDDWLLRFKKARGTTSTEVDCCVDGPHEPQQQQQQQQQQQVPDALLRGYMSTFHPPSTTPPPVLLDRPAAAPLAGGLPLGGGLPLDTLVSQLMGSGFDNNGGIAALAKEISEEILSEEEPTLQGQQQEEQATSCAAKEPTPTLLGQAGGGTGTQLPVELLGRVMQKVTSKLSSKISSGQLKQDQLMKEAFGLLSSFGLGGGGGGGDAQAGHGASDVLSTLMSSMR